MDHTIRGTLQHHLNPLHVYCRLRRAGVGITSAKWLCGVYEKLFYRQVLA